MKIEKNTQKDLVFEMTPTNTFTKKDCRVCGGMTNRDLVFCVARNDHYHFACRHCVKLGKPDESLKQRIKDLKEDIQRLKYTIIKSKKYIEEAKEEIDFCKTLFNHIYLPSYEEWEKVEAEAKAELGLGIME